MKLGIIGAGSIIQDFLPRLKTIKELNIKTIQGTLRSKEKVEKLANDNNIEKVVFDFEDLIKCDIDTVYIATPNASHYEYCKKALENGLNVVVEKPWVTNYNQALELKELAIKNHRYIFEAISTVYLDSYEQIRNWINKIGDIKLVNMNYSQYSRRYDAFKKGEILPVFDPNQAGGALMDLNVYNISFVLGLFGEPVTYQYYANIEKGIDTSGELIMKYPTFIANCTAAKDCAGSFNFYIQGDEGYISIKYPPNVIGEIKLHLNDNSEETVYEPMAMDRIKKEFEWFIKYIDEDDYDGFLKRLDASILVSKIMNESRKQAGIVFPQD